MILSGSFIVQTRIRPDCYYEHISIPIFLKIKKKKNILNFSHFKKTYLLTCAPNEDSNHPAHARNRIRAFIVRMKKLCILGYPKCAQWRFWSACANAQADLNLRWAHMSACTFSDIAAHVTTLAISDNYIVKQPITFQSWKEGAQYIYFHRTRMGRLAPVSSE